MFICRVQTHEGVYHHGYKFPSCVFCYQRQVNSLIIVNGNKRVYEENLSFADYLQNEGYRLSKIAVECNGEIVPRSHYAQRLIQRGDCIEIVHFVGGG